MKPYTALCLIPTGIGARVGGFAGDALPLVRTLAAAVDRLVTHPNVLNGATLFWPLPHTAYVEGYGIDRFCSGAWALRPVRQNRVGVVFDVGIEADLRLRHRHAIQAAQATLGLDVAVEVETDRPLAVEVAFAPSGASHGSLKHPDALLDAAGRALSQGAEALAIVARFPDDLDFSAYDAGEGVDPLAGVEAILSHLVVREFRCPCAHAPALRWVDPPETLHPRAAAEAIGFTFLPSVLAGLSYAPQFVPAGESRRWDDWQAADVDVVIVPETACGSPAVLALAQRDCPPLTIAVAENDTVMAATPRDLGIPATVVRSYLEAIGLVTAHRAGIALPPVLPLP